MNSNRHAYDIWQYMVKNGYYPLMPATAEAISEIATMYLADTRITVALFQSRAYQT